MHIDGHIKPLQRRADKPKTSIDEHDRQKNGSEDRAIGIDGPTLRPDARLCDPTLSLPFALSPSFGQEFSGQLMLRRADLVQ
jgi:hypothetical protein